MERLIRRVKNPSLFGEILHWMLVPLLVLWVISMAIEFLLSLSIANAAHDRELQSLVNYLRRQVLTAPDRLERAFPGDALLEVHRHDDSDPLVQVRNEEGRVVYGSRSLSAPTLGPETELQAVYFRDETVAGQSMRVAYLFARSPDTNRLYAVQAGESTERRVQLAFSITGGQLSVQFLIVPAALVLVWFGLAKGITPLNDLTRRVRDRAPHDLSPLDPAHAPEEVRAFIYSINDLMLRLNQSLMAQERFVSDAAHQLRTPIAGLKTQAELALRELDRADLRHSLHQIAAGADRASHLINQLLALAKADAHPGPRMVSVDLDQLACGAAREWVPVAREKGIDLGYECAQPPRRIEASPVLITELLNNLIDNAIRYTPSGGSVTVRVRSDDGVVLEVEDNGIGISPVERALVFERFYRVLGTETEGTGLGLAIVRAIAQAHGGRPMLESGEHGRGTLVRIVFGALAKDHGSDGDSRRRGVDTTVSAL
jgi:two-component system sensor histidine kinase TctE